MTELEQLYEDFQMTMASGMGQKAMQNACSFLNKNQILLGNLMKDAISKQYDSTFKYEGPGHYATQCGKEVFIGYEANGDFLIGHSYELSMIFAWDTESGQCTARNNMEDKRNFTLLRKIR